MPSTSKKQHNLMAAVANNPKFAKKVGIPRSVGEDFLKADKGRKFARGGEMKDEAYMKKERKHVAAMKKAGVPKSIVKEEMAEAGMKKGGKVKKMAFGGMSNAGGAMRGLDRAAAMSGRTMPTTGRPAGMKKGGACKKMAGGGYVRAADGVAKKGKTKGKMV